MAKTQTCAIIGAERMNRIMHMLMHKTMTMGEIVAELQIRKNAVHGYITQLQWDGKVQMKIDNADRRYKFYSLVPGAVPVPIPEPKKEDLPKKRGPRPGFAWKGNEGAQFVRTVPAQQVGMMRDPLVAALFGGATC
jgi:hypothetical protein